MQRKLPRFLPEFLKDWKFLPSPLRSLKPYDTFLKHHLCRCKCFQKLEISNTNDSSTVSKESDKKSIEENSKN